MLDFDLWQLLTVCLYLIGGYLFALYCYRVALSARQLNRQLARLKILVSKYFPPTA